MAGHKQLSVPNSDQNVPGIKQYSIPELLAPAGDWECAKAAVENGADAIYLPSLTWRAPSAASLSPPDSAPNPLNMARNVVALTCSP